MFLVLFLFNQIHLNLLEIADVATFCCFVSREKYSEFENLKSYFCKEKYLHKNTVFPVFHECKLLEHLLINVPRNLHKNRYSFQGPIMEWSLF